MGKIVLITGAHGFLGRALVNRLLNRPGMHIVAVDLAGSSAFSGLSGISYHSGNLNDAAFIEALKKEYRFDVIIHLAGVLSKGDSPEEHQELFDSNCRSTLKVLDLARSCGAAFVFPSTGLVYGDQKKPFSETMVPQPGDFYAQTKLICEECITYFAHRYGLRTVIFRPAIIYGPGQCGTMLIPSLVKAMLTDTVYPMTPGEQKRDFVYIGDVVDAFCRAIDNDSVNGVFNVGSGIARTIISVAELIQTLAGKHDLLRPGALQYRHNEVWDYCLDSSKAERELGWKAATEISIGINETLTRMKECN